ncbi:16S rRNA (guanine(966)-N(2))-methyltransferase RsmD [Paenisporosarcina sp. TG-14]|uniref:16S rRNA (guanine(966)-N(2))-methyltransferase RsmD n=1 Tax=Paenisporosarcina sp. TG-14 TaxID=1231057 RepID=UPI000301707A|nr:16S rRNA (guanine(966)-N(2))-methyltransferase RsmD [Paenisporosarcina sp. TG-14]
MRVISGTRKGLPLKAVPGTGTRPTTDKVKESIFNMIGPYFDGGLAVDLFAGSGGLGIESLSRGIDTCIFIEKDPHAIPVIYENLKKCKLEDQAEVYKADATRAIKALEKRQARIDLLFLDPPYQKVGYYELIEQFVDKNLLTEDAIILCEHEKGVDLKSHYGSFTLTRKEIYGSTIISIYRQEEGERNV